MNEKRIVNMDILAAVAVVFICSLSGLMSIYNHQQMERIIDIVAKDQCPIYIPNEEYIDSYCEMRGYEGGFLSLSCDNTEVQCYNGVLTDHVVMDCVEMGP